MCVVWLNDRLRLQMAVPVHTLESSHEVLYIYIYIYICSNLHYSLATSRLLIFSFQNFQGDISVVFFVSIFISDSAYLFMGF